MTDNGGDYVSGAFLATCDALAIRHVRTREYTPEQPEGGALYRDALTGVGLHRTVRHLARPSADAQTLYCSITVASDHARASGMKLRSRGARALRDEQRV